MKKLLAYVLAAVALVATGVASTGCAWAFLDEPKALKDMD